jgi:hypothetical protein
VKAYFVHLTGPSEVGARVLKYVDIHVQILFCDKLILNSYVYSDKFKKRFMVCLKLHYNQYIFIHMNTHKLTLVETLFNCYG